MINVDKINDNLKRLEEQSDEIIEVMSLKEQYKIFLNKFDSLTEKEKRILKDVDNIAKITEKNLENLFLKIEDSEKKIVNDFKEEKNKFLNGFIETRSEIVKNFDEIELLLKERINNVEKIANQNSEKNQQSLDENSEKISLIIKKLTLFSEKIKSESKDERKFLKEVLEEENKNINESVKNIENIIIEEKNNMVLEIKKIFKFEIEQLNEKLTGFKNEISSGIIENIIKNSRILENELVNATDKLSEVEKNNSGEIIKLKENINENLKVLNLELNNKLLEGNKLYLEKINELLVVNEKNKYEINQFKKYGLVITIIVGIIFIMNMFLLIR